MSTLVDAAALLARLSPQARLDVQAAALEAEQAAEKARQDAEIAERDARLAADPAFQEQVAAWKRAAEDEHRQKLDRLKALARQSGPRDPRPPQQGPAGWTMVGGDAPRFHCHECGSAIWGDVTLCGAFTLCEVCNARHLLRCDQCGASKDIITTRCRDGNYRCPSCMADPQTIGTALTTQQLGNGRFR
jgi:hypothetical protein